MVRRQVVIWGTTALATCVMLLAILSRQEKQDTARWSVFLMGDAHQGARLFTEKGCAHCHAVNGAGGKLASDLGIRRSPESSLPQLVTAMWNHAPRMWETMRAEKMDPDLNYEEMAHLFSYLYVVRYVDEPGNAQRGQQLFQTKGCVTCHALHTVGSSAVPEFPPGNFTGAQGGQVAADSLGWTQAMWNHALTMQTRAQAKGVSWPSFAGHEMNDLVAFLNQSSAIHSDEVVAPTADPARGWDLFQKKGCIRCHSVQDDKAGIGLSLGPKHPLPDSSAQFAGIMWNHAPDMFAAMKAHGQEPEPFAGRDMADVMAFLYSLHYFEPGGSPQVGESVFAWRGCAQCHGPLGEGNRLGPALRGRGQSYTSIRLATVLWRHGAEMTRESKDKNLTWPNLQEADVGHLLSFLNSPAH